MHLQRPRHAIVIGGSMSGLFAGLMLRIAGWSVDIYEKVEGELSGRGAGIVAQPEILAALRDLGLGTGELGVPVQKRRLFDIQGRITLETECPQVMTAWERVYRILRDGFPAAHYHRGRSLQAIEQNDVGVTAIFADGERVIGDMLVGADGIRSTVRGLCAPDSQPRYAGYSAWRALIAEGAMPDDVHRDIFPYMAFCLPPGEQMLGYPVAGPDDDLRPGHRRYNMIWYRPADERTELVSLLTDEKGVEHSLSIPPPLISRASIAGMRDAAARLLSPQFRTAVTLVDQPILQPIFDLVSDRIAFGRVAIVGDAAFVARPHVGAGVAKAAGDAAALVAALGATDDVVSALSQYQTERLPEGLRMVQRARHLGAYLQASRNTEEAALAARHSVSEAVLEETATLDFLYA
ncbi:FAD-dependent monooxygenase [Pseudorhodoplanes sp.]|uniref:FAD binding domain-containing protein n=1 Tax=Pseudorhodoplanes sp. TaxID=1934341 RepID=UPI002C967DDA|nr:FAD-dependent monooxygenase [Pseudorhodoplanes sp.]HWV51622.1 FAD-dependent monooxygenase [Pseudorhodoplanes sp.]